MIIRGEKTEHLSSLSLISLFSIYLCVFICFLGFYGGGVAYVPSAPLPLNPPVRAPPLGWKTCSMFSVFAKKWKWGGDTPPPHRF